MREKDVIERYGVPKDELKAFRKTLVEGIDWDREIQASKPPYLCPAFYMESGLDKVFEKFGLKKPDSAIMAPAAPPPEEITQATVIRCDYPNIRIMLVRLSNGKSVFANVNDSRRFKPKLPIAVVSRGNRFFCEHRPTSILRINQLIKRNTNEVQPSQDGQDA
jgi:hypothetical protein